MAEFAVGDEVRVKAGSPVFGGTEYSERPKSLPKASSFGTKQRVYYVVDASREVDLVGLSSDIVHSDYLEPWNDAEHWDGKAWVAKKPVESKTGLTFWEAVEHLRKHGGSCVHFPYSSLEIEWSEGHLRLSGDKQKVPVNAQFLDSEWRVATKPAKPAKQYDFSEAYQMMKQGKWMKCVIGTSNFNPIRFYNGAWKTLSLGWSTEPVSPIFTTDKVEAKWVEVTEPQR